MTELTWEGKYDKDGHKVAPLRVHLPFQTVETIKESAQERQRKLDLFGSSRPSEWRNRLIWGDKKYVLPALLEEFAGQVDLICIDPPFDTGQDFSFQVHINGEDFTKEPSIIEKKAYRDTWGVSPEERAAGKTHLDKYLQWFYETVIILHELLADTGTVYVHCDWRVNAYLRCILDEVFGADNFINEITWKRRGGILAQSRQYGANTDTIFFIAKSPSYKFSLPMVKEGAEDYIDERFKYTDENGRKYRLSPIVSPSYSPNLIYDYKGYKPPTKGWSASRETMEQWDREGKLVFPKDKTQRIQRKQYLDEWQGRPTQTLWDSIPPINPQALERPRVVNPNYLLIGAGNINQGV